MIRCTLPDGRVIVASSMNAIRTFLSMPDEIDDSEDILQEEDESGEEEWEEGDEEDLEE